MVSALAFNVYTLPSHQSDYEHLSPFSLKYDKALVLRKFRIMICTFFLSGGVWLLILYHVMIIRNSIGSIQSNYEIYLEVREGAVTDELCIRISLLRKSGILVCLVQELVGGSLLHPLLQKRLVPER